MNLKEGTTHKGNTAPMGQKATSGLRHPLVSAVISVFGLGSICYVLGAAVMFFDLPSSSFLHRAFVGGAAWYEQGKLLHQRQKRVPSLRWEKSTALISPVMGTR